MNSQYPLEKFNETGFSVVNINKEDNDISDFTKNWIKFLLGNQAAKNPTNIHEIINVTLITSICALLIISTI